MAGVDGSPGLKNIGPLLLEKVPWWVTMLIEFHPSVEESASELPPILLRNGISESEGCR